MVSILPYVLLTISITIAIVSSIYSFVKSKSIFSGEETSPGKAVINSIIFGISIGSLMFVITMIAWLSDKTNYYTLDNFISSLIISILVGIIGFGVAMWRFFIVGKFRNYFLNRFRKKDD